MKLVYQVKMYDYRTREEANEHKKQMREEGWVVKDEYKQEYSEGYSWTIEYHK